MINIILPNYICRSKANVRLYSFTRRSITDAGVYTYTEASDLRLCQRIRNNHCLLPYKNAIQIGMIAAYIRCI